MARDNRAMGYMVNLSLQGREALVVGGGEIAWRKAQDLLAAKATVTVVAPQLCTGMTALAAEGSIRVHQRPYESSDIGGAFVVIAATDDNAVNTQVFHDASARNALVNVVDVPLLCNFYVPATVTRGDLTIAISTDGRCPALASILREEMQGDYGPEYAALVTLFGALRKKMIAQGWKGATIRAKLAEIYRAGVLKLLAAGDKHELSKFLASRIADSTALE
jgi:precorrin-2 dehydrogenase / sirohydrochlorin ferrochelatase